MSGELSVPLSLVLLLDGVRAGTVHRDGDQLRLVYDEAWRGNERAYPLSLSLPLRSPEHPHEAIEPFLWGLLPDDPDVLSAIGAEHHVSPRNAFALLAHVGEDCAGAVQLVRAERLDEGGGLRTDDVRWLEPEEIAARLEAARLRKSLGRSVGTAGRFSLAGKQPKIVLLRHQGRWGEPSGRVPTTHILKPPTTEVLHLAENEHFCLQLARSLGLSAAAATVETFGDELALVVKRYDRFPPEPLEISELHRVHQEDLCQATGRPPTKRYQSDGGPSPREIIQLLRDTSSAPQVDVDSFVDALGFNWLIVGTDAHAKNYSLLLAGGQVRLAPLYDLASWLPYEKFHDLALPMKIGHDYSLRRTGKLAWEELASETGLDGAALLDRLRAMAAALPDEAARIRDRCVGEGLAPEFVAQLAQRLTDRARDCSQLLAQA